MGQLLRLLGGMAGGSGIVVRNIASNTRAPGANGGAASNGVDTTANSRTSQVNESGKALTNLALVYSGWRTRASAPSETDLPNDYTVTASIEYPSGTFTQVTWSGTTSKVITAGSNIVSDYMAVAIPAGARFWVRSFVSVTAGGVWPTSGTMHSGSPGLELYQTGTGLSDMTMGGTIVGTSQGFRASGFLSRGTGFKKVSLGVFGDSIASGSGDGVYDTNSNTSWIGRAASGNCPILTTAIVGVTLADNVLNLTRRLDLFQKCGITHVLCAWGANDVAVRTAPQIQADLTTLYNAIIAAGMKPVQTTTTPKSTTADFWYTEAGQTAAAGYTGGEASVRGVVNNWVRALNAGLYDYIETADNVETARSSSIWKAGNTQTTYLAPNTDVWTVGVGATTTSVPSNSTAAADYYRFGRIKFLTGALAGTMSGQVSGQTVGGTFTVPALASAPTAGDTFSAYPQFCNATNDGLHPNVSSSVFGGHIIMKEVAVPKIQGWNA